jgi:uncharacterized protein (TIGR03083 family)
VDDRRRAAYLSHIERESGRFGNCLAAADPSAPVPTCPGWTADDLLWHLAEVQLFWTAIVGNRLDDPDLAEEGKPPRPTDHDELVALFRSATPQLLNALSTTPPDTKIWTWVDSDPTAGFVIRWQANEALIHRVDAELAVGDPTGLDADLATDGIDAALAYVYADVPAWSTFTPDATGRLETIDTGATWNLQLGKFSGTSPNTGKVYDNDIIRVVEQPDGPPDVVVSGPAADLDQWLFGRRPADPLAITGDQAAFSRLAAIVAAGVQ